MAAVNVPVASITDIATRPPTPLALTALTVNALDDTHTVDAVDEPPRRPRSDTIVSNAIEPTTVTLMLPDVAAFVGSSDEMVPPLYVTTAVIVPACMPAVTAARRDGDAPEADLTLTAVSDVHNVLMATVPPTCALLVRSSEPPMA